MTFLEKISKNYYTCKLVLGSPGSAERKACASEMARLDAEFRAAALQECGLTGHPKADQAYALAYQYGHASGYSDIWTHLSEFADLVR